MDNLTYLESTKNKEFLWNLLYEKKVFSNIPNNMINDVKILFEKSIENSINNIKKQNIQTDLLNLNKVIVKNLNSEINIFKENISKENISKENISKENISNFTKENNVSKSVLKNEKLELINLEFEKQKKNMNEVLILKKPEEIDFSDKKKNEAMDTETMNNILEKMVRDRNILNTSNTDKDLNKDQDKDLDNIFVNNLIDKNNITNSIDMEEKKKLLNIDDFLNIDGDKSLDGDKSIDGDKIKNSLKDSLKDRVEMLKFEDSRVSPKDIHTVTSNEYKHESYNNLNIKVNNIYKIINNILENQTKIMQKLEI